MKPMTQILTTLVAMILLLPSCTESIVYPAAMQQAIACMDSRPDSAQFYLSSLTDSTLAGEAEEVRMYHALLSIKAADKLYQTHTSDSLIRSIVRYYEEHSDGDKLMEAYFYLGSTYRDMNDAPRALKAYQQALDAGEESTNYTLLGMTYGQMGTLYAYQELYEEALEAKKKALEHYQVQNETQRILFAYRDIARMYDALDKNDMAELYYQEAYRLSLENKDQKITNSLMGEMGCFYYKIDKINTAKMMLSMGVTDRKPSNELLHLGAIYQEEGKLDSAQHFLYQAIESRNIYVQRTAYHLLSKKEAEKRNYPLAYQYLKLSQEYSDSIDEITRTEAVKKVQSLYNYQHTEAENHRLAMKNESYRHSLSMMTLFVVILLGIAAYIIYIIKRNRQETIQQERRLRLLKEEQYARSLAYIEENERKLEVLEEKLQEAEQNNDTLNKQFLLLQKETLEQSNRQTVVERDKRELLEKAFRQSNVYLRFHKSDFRATENDWKELQTTIDLTFPNFTDKLYNLYPQISQHELRLCYLIRLSLTYMDMANILGRTPSAITKARTRLYKKIYGEGVGDGDMDKVILDL